MRSSILAFLLISLHCFAQQPVVVRPLVLSNVSEENGLSDNHVQCVLKDREGLVWIGTSDGLNLMDGSTIKVFKHIINDSTSLVDNEISCLTEDHEGNIWIGTTSGLSCYQRTKHTFFSATPSASPYGSSAFINSIVIDNHSRIWCSSDGGLMQFDPVHRKFSFYYNLNTRPENNTTYSNRLQYIMMDSRDIIWLCSADGLWSFNPGTSQFKNEISRSNDPKYHELFLYVFEDHNKTIWVGNWQYGLKQYDPVTGKVTNYESLPGCPTTINRISEIRDPDGKYVLWLNGKLIAFDPQEKKFFHYQKALKASDYPYVVPAFQSPDRWVWLASDKGLYIYSPIRQNFRYYFFDSSAFTSQNVVFAELDKTLLVGAQGKKFLTAYDSNWMLLKRFSLLQSNPLPGKNDVASLAITSENDHRLWIGSSGGVAQVDLPGDKARWFVHKDNDSTTPPRNFIANLFFDSHKQLWIFPWREGIWQMDTQTGKCRKLIDGFIREPDHIKRLLIADAIEDSSGNIWMADLDEGIILYDRHLNTFSKPFAKELGEKYHTSRIFLRNGYLYANTAYYIFKWHPVTRKLQIFTPPAEMIKNIYDMAPDKESNWWLGTRNGLIVFDEQHHSFRRYTTNDGLANNDLNGTIYCRNDGMMLIGMSDYITSFDPAALNAISGTVGKVVLTDLQVNEKSLPWDSTRTLELDHRSTNVLFRWALPDYASPLKNQYYCQLLGIDANWRYLGNEGEIQYANLSPGKYRILLKAASANGTASSNIIDIRFVIHPPYWKTTWFILACVAAFLTLLIIVVRYISRRNLKEKLLRLEKEQAVEKERNRISRDMHDDLGSGLTKIAIMSEVVKKQINEPEKARQQLENISVSSRELVDSLQDIIWVLNPKNDTLESLTAYIREYGLKFFEPFGTRIHFDYPEKFDEVKLSEETRRNIFLVIKEAFNNIAKHAWCNNVQVAIRHLPASIVIGIKDDGKGFDEEKVRLFGNGLVNMKNRIEQIGGQYKIQSAPGEGTGITIEVPL